MSVNPLLTMFISIVVEAARVTLLVLVMMVVVDLVNVRTKGKLDELLRTGGQWKQYIVSSLLGSAPGCIGSFAGVSLYIHGMIGIGALTGLMFATAGDEQFVMLALFPRTALILFAALFVLGIIVGYVSDFLVKRLKIKTCTDCVYDQYHPGHEGYRHYLREHVWKHIIKGHLLRVFLWTFGALMVVNWGMSLIDLQRVTEQYPFFLLLSAAVIGLIPESGPHLIFVMLFSNGMIPFSVLLTSSIVQDGHGMLPMLSYSIKDSVLIKVFNFFYGIGIGSLVFAAGY